jgi:ATP-dependent Lon protease
MSYAPGTVIDEVSLFPLPNVVFFPGTVLPLHVFEPRYRLMTERALAGNKQICVVWIRDRRRVDEHGHPPICQVACVGEIIKHQALPDGRHNIVLSGKARVALEELPFTPPYRRARARVLGSTDARISDTDIAALISIATRFAARVRMSGPLEFTLPPTYEPGLLADACANALVIDPGERQRVLETLDIPERLCLTSELLAVQEALLARSVGLH